MVKSEHDDKSRKAKRIKTIEATQAKVAFAHGCFHALRDETTPSAVALEGADCPFKKAHSINRLTTSSEILRCSLPTPLLTLLKCQQSLGYLPACDAIPPYVRPYLVQQLRLPPETGFHDTPHARARYRQLIGGYLEVHAYAAGGSRLVEERVTQAAYTMSDPADLINVAIEQLIAPRFEPPAFQTLDRLVSHVRYGVHQDLSIGV